MVCFGKEAFINWEVGVLCDISQAYAKAPELYQLNTTAMVAADAGVFTCITKHNKSRLVVVSGEIQNLTNGCVAGDNTCNGVYKLEAGLV
jgi:hypothetical protein